MKKFFTAALLASAFAIPAGANAAIDHLIISEFAVTPTAGEFIEIYNPTGATVDLSDYYISDATFDGGGQYYYNIVSDAAAGPGGGGFGDFSARFPAGATIAAGEYQVIALNGADNFVATYPSVTPDYEIVENATADTAGVPDMRTAAPDGTTDLLTGGGLTNSGEVIAFFKWDGVSDLVEDVDYVDYEDGSTGAAGGNSEAVDKTGVSIDSDFDADTTASAYANDTAIASQIPANSHGGGASMERLDVDNEAAETSTGGNGITGHDETSENFFQAFTVSGAPSPGEANGATSIRNWEDFR